MIRIIQSFVFRHANRVVVPSVSFGSYLHDACRIAPSRIVVNERPAERGVILPFEIEQRPGQVLVVGGLPDESLSGSPITIVRTDPDASRAESWAQQKASAVLVVDAADDGALDAIVRGFVADTPVVAFGDSGVDGVLSTNAAGLSDAIHRVLSDADLRTHLRAQGSQTVRGRFSWDAHLTRLETALMSV